MVEVRTVSRTAVAERSGGGFFIRRVESPGAVVEKGAAKRLARRPLTPSSNKENVPPAWAVATTQKRRSTLPEWYPRSPLRDITSIIKAVERKNLLRDAAARQQLQWTEDSSEPENPAQADQDVHRRTPPTNGTLAAAAVASDPAGSAQAVASTSATCVAEGTLKAATGDCSLQTPSRQGNHPALSDLLEKLLASSIEQIEKMVCQNLTLGDPKAAQPSKTQAVQRRTLMSMR
ncbi:protein GIGAS CELL1 [Brachypodium distachyon]|uniref:Uncharacterized protein n=1 Tax=Brachypodium distachyon TaxID=15368 RepID=I1IB35_BRADI|nr:protein GIGAS CELL1 [Brachypodium distachyon]XP_014755814.1 protein GIGAS CELL1 [Brachypodium distachyon]KQK00114.1 hypothetical protein BRADI_3g47430v3 [Brachypodium distachyon]KQK00115.1 hypothetical protein BRADI_3g47430v3 [Brachypodium distachyon]|eukprot:XP_010235621.1 protein GIGAS CELL1 [Brachypodium distachyon]